MISKNAGKTQAKFTLLDILDKLEPAKEKDKYICPVCGGHNLSINKATGAYQCFNCGDSKAIYKACLNLANENIITHDNEIKKSIRPKKTTEYFYPDREGNPLVKIVRKDFGNGKKSFSQFSWDGEKWESGRIGKVEIQDIPLYRYAETMQAISEGKKIIFCEGESVCDRLWEINFPATTTIEGSGKKLKDIGIALADLKNAEVILAPDLDENGIKFMDLVADVVNSVGWLYAFPDSYKWKNPPENHGVDLVDYLNDYPQTTAEDLLSMASQKKSYPTVQLKVVPITREDPDPRDYRAAVADLLAKDLSESELDVELSAIASKFYKTDNQVWRLYKTLVKEDEKTENLQDTAAELESLLKASNASLNLENYLPGDLIQIKEVYKRLCLRPEVGLMQFLSTVSGLLPTGSEIRLLNYTNFDQPMGVYFAVCAEPSQRKTPGQKAIVTKPLLQLQKQADEIHRQQMMDYEVEYQTWKESKEGLPPEEPKKRVYFINSATQAGLRRILNEQRSHGFVILHDELAADFRNRSKKYNSGLTEDLLSFYDGLGKREALGDGFASEFDEVLISVLGAIQPGVVAEFLNGENDPNGYWSRLSLVNQPVTQLIIPPPEKQAPPIDLTPLLARIYERVSNLPKFKLHFSEQAEELMRVVMNRCDEHRVKARTQGLAAQWGKMAGKIGRLAAIIHIVEKVFNNQSIDSPVSKKTLNKAVQLGYFLLNEAINLYADNSEDNLAAHLKQILAVASSNPNTDISARMVQSAVFVLRKEKSEVIRGYFEDLVELGYGQTVGTGTRKKFRAEGADSHALDLKSSDRVSFTQDDKSADQVEKPPQPTKQRGYSDSAQKSADECRSKISTSNSLEKRSYSQSAVIADQKKIEEDSEPVNLVKTLDEDLDHCDPREQEEDKKTDQHYQQHQQLPETASSSSEESADPTSALGSALLDQHSYPNENTWNEEPETTSSSMPSSKPGLKVGERLFIPSVKKFGKIAAKRDGQFLISFQDGGSDWLTSQELSLEVIAMSNRKSAIKVVVHQFAIAKLVRCTAHSIKGCYFQFGIVTEQTECNGIPHYTVKFPHCTRQLIPESCLEPVHEYDHYKIGDKIKTLDYFLNEREGVIVTTDWSQPNPYYVEFLEGGSGWYRGFDFL